MGRSGGKNKMEITEKGTLLLLRLSSAEEKDKPKILSEIFEYWLKENGFRVSSISDDKKVVIIGECKE